MARNDVPVRAKEQLPLEVRGPRGRNPERGRRPDERPHACAPTCSTARRPASSSTSARTTCAAARYARGGKALDCFTSTGGFALHLAAQLRERGSRRQLVARPRHRARQRRTPTPSPTWISAKPTSSSCWPDMPPRAATFRWWCSTRRPSPSRATTSRRGPRLQGDQPARPAPARSPAASWSPVPARTTSASRCFLELLAEAALDANRTLRILERRTQTQDHPILLTVPETHYLKCLILEVM